MKLTSHNLLHSPSKGHSSGLSKRGQVEGGAPESGAPIQIIGRKTAVSGGFFAPRESDRLCGFFKQPETAVSFNAVFLDFFPWDILN
jgi:hypothetical protein